MTMPLLISPAKMLNSIRKITVKLQACLTLLLSLPK